MRISAVFLCFLLVYTQILEQKRIAGQAYFLYICNLFYIYMILHHKP